MGGEGGRWESGGKSGRWEGGGSQGGEVGELKQVRGRKEHVGG